MDFLDSTGGLAIGYAVMIAIGLVLGGFLSRAAFRIPAEKPVWKPGPMCLTCEASIASGDRIPVLGYFLTGGKCRHCGEKISPLYPAIEIVTPLLFAAVFWRFGWSIAMPVYAAFAAAMVLVTFVDLIDWTIPDEVTIPGIFIGIACGLIAMALPQSGLQIKYLYSGVFDAIGGAILGGVLLIAIDLIALMVLKKKGMGFGDVKLNAMIGAFIGYKGVLLSFVIACLIGSVIGVAMVAINRSRQGENAKPGEGNYLPFGPYLAIGGLIVVFFGAEIAEFYIEELLPNTGPY
jgi:leader peptidase (prepilin peptidase) / N-methyltransferase